MLVPRVASISIYDAPTRATTATRTVGNRMFAGRVFGEPAVVANAAAAIPLRVQPKAMPTATPSTWTCGRGRRGRRCRATRGGARRVGHSRGRPLARPLRRPDRTAGATEQQHAGGGKLPQGSRHPGPSALTLLDPMLDPRGTPKCDVRKGPTGHGRSEARPRGDFQGGYAPVSHSEPLLDLPGPAIHPPARA